VAVPLVGRGAPRAGPMGTPWGSPHVLPKLATSRPPSGPSPWDGDGALRPLPPLDAAAALEPLEEPLRAPPREVAVALLLPPRCGKERGEAGNCESVDELACPR